MTTICKKTGNPLHNGFLIILLFGMFIGCKQQNAGQETDLQDVKIGVTSTYQGEAATYVAKEKGFFEDHGLNVTFKSNSSGKESLFDLLDGVVQIAHVAETPFIYSIVDTSFYSGNSIPSFQIFADQIYSHKIQRIIARKDHGIIKAEDIVGKKVGLYQGTQLDYFFDSFLLEHQILREELEIVNISPEQQFEAIQNGEIDVSVSWEPYASYIKKELGDNATYLDTDLTYSTLWLSTTMNTYAEENPKILISYLQALKKAQDYIRKNPLYAQQLLSDKTSVPLDVIQSLWTEMDYDLSLSERMLTLLEEQTRWMIRNNVADTTIQSIEQFINFGPLEEVNPDAITVVK